MLAWFPGGIEAINEVAAATNQNAQEALGSANAALAAQAGALATSTKVATSYSNLTLAAGVKTVVLQETGRTLEDDEQVVLIYLGDVENRMIGSIDAIAGQTLTVTVAEGGVIGSGGPYNRWAVISASLLGVGASVEEERAGESKIVNSTPGSRTLAQAAQTLTSAATVAWDVAEGANARLTLTGNHQIGEPSNLKDGLIYTLDVNPATYTPTWNAIWDFGPESAPYLRPSAWTKVRAQYNEDRDKLEVIRTPVGWIQIASQAAPGGTSAIDFTSIPQGYSDLLVVIEGASTASGISDVKLSVGRSSFSTAQAISPSPSGASGAFYGSVLIPHYREDAGSVLGGAGVHASDNSLILPGSFTPLGATWRVASGIERVRISVASDTFDAGTFTLYARP
ncbi:hypothetical protein ACO2Q0_02545 [Phenylobacterium sp. VNQ135]